MLREYHYIWRGLFIGLDLSMSALAFLAAYWVRFLPPVVERFGPEILPPLSAYLKVVPALFVVQWITNSYFKLYHPRRISSFFDEITGIVKSSGFSVLVVMSIFFFDRGFSYSRSIVALFALFNPIALIGFRLAIRIALRHIRAKGYNLRHILIVGTGRPAQELIHRLQRNPWTGMNVTGLVTCSKRRVGKKIHGVTIIGHVDEIDAILERWAVDQVYLALPPSRRLLTERLAKTLTERLLVVRLVPDVGYSFTQEQLADFDGLPVVSVMENRLRGWNAFTKRAMDMVISLIGLTACAPLFLLIGILVKATSRGPVFYSQKRMGLDGRIFRILKFRTMRLNADNEQGWTRRNDDRCTPFGRFLRRTSMDELPQLFNVVAGQMSLVGPRPERPKLIEEFRKNLPRYMLRHQFKAGITGWAQVNGWRGDTSLRKRLQYDLYYQRHWSIWFDLKILALTFIRGIVHPNAY